MTGRRSRRGQRAAFTLIELLVVIAIIAVLVSLSAAGVMKILNKIPEVQTRTDISMMDASLGNMMGDFGLDNPPPSTLILREDMSYPAGDPSGNFLRKMFGRNLGTAGAIDWNGNGKLDGPHILEGEQCLIFYLGGIPSIASGTPQCLGFSTNNQNPAAVGGARRGPYFEFKSARLKLLTEVNPKASTFFVYLDAWQSSTSPFVWPSTSSQGTPYAYFSSSGNNNTGYTQGLLGVGKDCQSIGATPYHDAGGNFTFSNKYQIISAGQNGVFGIGTWNPSSGASDPGGRDDQANFARGLLMAGQQ